MIKLITATTFLFYSNGLLAFDRELIVKNIQTQAVEVGVDPDLAVAIATVESRLNPNAIGSLGEVGLFQLRPEYHDIKSKDPSHNTLVALRYLKSLKDRFGVKYGAAWFVIYNYGPSNRPSRPSDTRYFKKVMCELEQIKTKRYLAKN